MGRPRCDECIYFDLNDWRDRTNGGGTIGECHRNPAVLERRYYDWCGEWCSEELIDCAFLKWMNNDRYHPGHIPMEE